MYRYLSGEPYTHSQTEAQLARFREHWQRHGFGVYAVEERVTGRLVGRCGPAFHRLWPADPELGWMLDPDVWGRGYATEAGAACLPRLFEELGFERVVSIVHPQNERSISVQDRLGFRDWRAVYWETGGVMLLVRLLARSAWSEAGGRRIDARNAGGALQDGTRQ